MLIEENILLSGFTTMQLGGSAKYFTRISSREVLLEALEFAKSKSFPYFILGGGSNTIVSDSGFSGLVIKIESSKIEILSEDSDSGLVTISAEAGVAWDEFVKFSIAQGFSGIECLSGIPGTVGATPIQNVGAYGQEVSETILSLVAVHPNGETKTFFKEECGFSYRNSKFKSGDLKDWIVISVLFQFSAKNPIQIKYPELQKAWESKLSLFSPSGQPKDRVHELQELREIVLSLRRKKSMVIDPIDPDSISAGSFFTNPILNSSQLQNFLERLQRMNLNFPSLFLEPIGRTKISAAWLIENAGFQKGYTVEGIGISKAHSLALVNRGGNTNQLLSLMNRIVSEVESKFGIHLEREPVLLG
ncbi:UDP-N-acetylmuramate dehydrogenase [Leptospira ilyithenensis]|uniref:UDP-N-acetylenolpyruvoylglucosamine reductase n=1 Tax=Leptospira ilyithenensis TaxID=2484901 RepID=A0A4R9LR83_9LEPT|nr:UDP-N-acetylmuramate dehydrogenase [Leptospira ilyithenensis]TGN10882.1 UDP-N-acetylmuramate dehydrogenase [Leptospira ilyithenensis]